MEFTVTVFDDDRSPVVGTDLEALGDALMSALAALTEGTDITGDVAATLASGEVTFCVALGAPSPRDAFERIDALITAVMAYADVAEKDVAWRQTTSRREDIVVAG